MALKIVQAGEAVLRRQASPLIREEILRKSSIQVLIEEMRETMRAAPGVGLAAPQVGVSLQIAVIEDRRNITSKRRPSNWPNAGAGRCPFTC